MQLVSIVLVSIPDIEGFLSLVLKIEQVPTHGFLHSVFGSLFIGFLFLAGILVGNTKGLEMGIGRLEALFYAIVPLFFHLGLDVFMHPDIRLWYPFNPEPNRFASFEGASRTYEIGFISLFTFLLLKMLKTFRNELKKFKGK